jgi:hypothetical protein
MHMFSMSRFGAPAPEPAGAAARAASRRKPSRNRALACALTACALIATLIPAAAQSAAADSGGSIVFSGAPGTSAPPATLGSYSMTPFGADPQAVGAPVAGVTGPSGPISFSPTLTHQVIGDGWQTWSNGYGGDVYTTGDAQSATVTLPSGTSAFYLYAEPDEFSPFSVTATAQDGTSSGPETVDGDAGAAYFGFYGTDGATISTITVSTAGDDFAIGEFGIAAVTNEIAAVRFAPLASIDPTVPGVPVIKDDGSSPVTDTKTGPTYCADGLEQPRNFDYVDCANPPSGTPAKNWPVVYVAGAALTVNQVVLFSQDQPTDPQLTATATIGGKTLTLASTPLDTTSTRSPYELYASDLAFTGNLPTAPGVDTLAITWTITSSGTSTNAGTSDHPVYVTAGSYAQPEGVGAALAPPLLSLLDIGTRAAAGQVDSDGNVDPRMVFNAIWSKFTSLSINHPVLDPVTGTTTDGPLFEYYDNGFYGGGPLDPNGLGDWWNKTIGYCPDILGFLATDSGHCGSWAMYLSYVLAFQGISSTYVSVGDDPGFYAGPNPPSPKDPTASPVNYAYMLIGPSLWSFSSPTGTGTYPYVDPVTVSDGLVTIAGSEVSYTASSTPISQGGVSTPPELFLDGDHAIVDTPWGYVDPSYGNPMTINPNTLVIDPYTSFSAYEKTAIAGFGVIYYKDSDGTYLPMKSTSTKTEIVNLCSSAAAQCQFRATPYTAAAS